uniref:Uncharacterized protein n=1 Tax=Rhizophora mucronata TaxID=61149 RepID=A0A2P2JVP7_RHIMU
MMYQYFFWLAFSCLFERKRNVHYLKLIKLYNILLLIFPFCFTHCVHLLLQCLHKVHCYLM